PMEVLIDGEPAIDVRVYDDTLLTCIAPDWRGSVNVASDPLPVAVDVTLTNLDDDGVAIGGETVTEVGAFTYTRQRVTAESPSWLTRVVRALVEGFRRNVLFNTSLNKHSESYDLASGSLRELSEGQLPGLSLDGPSLRANPAYTNNHRQKVSGGGFAIDEHRRHYVVDMEFDIFGFSDRSDELANLIELCTEYLHAHGHILVDPDPATGETERREYDVMWVPNQEPRVQGAPNQSNLKVFSGRIVVLGVDIDTRDVLRRDYLRDDLDPVLGVEMIVLP
ncbi:MAG TPA: hypothetical protein VMY39_08705, partial [Planctomycetota bacterium]|nr:hypothetical protein [Planctomycetota bacterium]